MKNLTGKIIKAASYIFLTAVTFGIGATIFTGASGVAHAQVDINESTFPDPAFRAVISGGDYDRDGNGVLDDNELGSTINIYCEGMGISSVQGVEYFWALQGLWCKDNNISSLNLSGNPDLRGLWCSGNSLTSLDLSACPSLEWVYCYDCNISSLNVSNNPRMAFIECNTNPLPSLDVTHNPELEHLTCGSCELTSLDLSNCPKLAHLDAFRNHFTSLDVSHNPKMKRLDIWDNPGLGSIDVSHNPGLQYYNCANNGATSINVSNNPELQKLICSYNSISSLDVSHNPKLVYLDCACNQISSLNLQNNPDLYFLQAFTNNLGTLDISYNPSLVLAYNTGVKKYESAVCQGHSWTIDYGGDTSTGGDNIFFLCFDDKTKLVANSVSSNETAPDEPENTEGLVTREYVVWTLYNMAGCPDTTGLTSRFKDVKSGAWYEKALLWGEKNAICMGYPNVGSENFGVGKCITRQDLAFMLMRYSEYKNYKRAIDFGRSDDFIDYYDIDYYAWEAICWAITWHIMDGKGEAGAPKSEQRIDPHGRATKAEFEDMVKRMMSVNGQAAPSFLEPPEDVVADTKDEAGETNSSVNTAVIITMRTTETVANVEFSEDEENGKVSDGNTGDKADGSSNGSAGDDSDGNANGTDNGLDENGSDDKTNADGLDSANSGFLRKLLLNPLLYIIFVIVAGGGIFGIYKIVKK